MKKMFSAIAGFLLVLLSVGIGEAQVAQRYFAEVRDEIGRTINDATVQVFVYDTGTKSLSTIYSDAALTAKSNPVSVTQFNTDNMVDFYSTATSHDVLVATTTGEVHLFSGMTKNDHSIIVNKNQTLKHLIISFSGTATTEQDTGFDLPLNAIVLDAILEVTTAAASQTINIGLSSGETAGDADGFLAAAASSATGFVNCNAAINNGTNIDFANGQCYGVLLASAINGSDAVATQGGFARRNHFVTGSNAKSITYTRSNSTSSAGLIHIFYSVMR